jgi:hypothetical protein
MLKRFLFLQAVRIALEVKKHLVDTGALQLTQTELEDALFAVLRRHGYGQTHVDRFRLVSSFSRRRRAIVVLLSGTAATGKSAVAQQLASRLNMPSPLQTDALRELLHIGDDGAAPPGSGGDLRAKPLWARGDLGEGWERLAAAYRMEALAVRRALSGDLAKVGRASEH